MKMPSDPPAGKEELFIIQEVKNPQAIPIFKPLVYENADYRVQALTPACRVGRMPGMSRSVTRWVWSFFLLLPVILLYACEYLSGDGKTFTGFIQYDQAFYMANARCFWDGGIPFLYRNPFSDDPNTPAIYFQPQFFLLGTILKLIPIDPGTLYVLFGFISGLVAIRGAIALYEQVAVLDRRASWMGLILFVWGGGILTIVGWIYHQISGRPPSEYTSDLFHFDPFGGWWFLNFGRNLVLPSEAYYHAVGIGIVLMTLWGRFRWALGLALLLSLSHPYSGVQFLLILISWCALELTFVKSREVPWWYLGGLGAILTWHLFYYLFFLSLFTEHRSIALEYAKTWSAHASSFIPADLLVGVLAYVAMRTLPLAQALFARPINRLLLVWFLVSFLLGHHEFAFEPMTPIHFLRGYTWMPLFLLGVQPLLRLLDGAHRLDSVFLRSFALAALMFIGLLDNLTWVGFYCRKALMPRLGVEVAADGFRLSPSDYDLQDWLNKRPGPHLELLLAPNPDEGLVYLTLVYTDYRGWYGHSENTPYAIQRRMQILQYFHDGTVPAEWHGRSFLIIFSKKDTAPDFRPAGPIVYENPDYEVQELSVP